MSDAPQALTGVDRLLRIVAPVRRGEGVTALLLALNVFVLLTCYYVLKVVREPLILLGGGAELKAYASAGQTILLLAVVPGFGWLSSRVDRTRLLTIVQLCFMMTLVAFYVLAQANAPIGLAFYLWLGIFNVFVVSNFWSFANDLYTQEQGRRLFAIIGLGASIGAIAGALIPSRLHAVISTFELMLVAAGGLALSILLYRVIDNRERVERDPAGRVALLKPEAVRPVGRDGGFALVAKDRYLRVMAAMVLVATMANTIGEYVVSRMAVDASRAYAEAARGEFLRNFFSDYYTVVNAVSAILQALLVSRLLGKLGVRRTLLVLPVIVVGGWVVFLASATLATIRATKTAENSVDYSLQNTLRQALYLPTSRESKYKAKAAIDTFFFRVGDVLAGLVLVFVLVEVMGAGVRALAITNLVLAALWLLLARRTGQLHDQRAAERAARAAQGLRETEL